MLQWGKLRKEFLRAWYISNKAGTTIINSTLEGENPWRTGGTNTKYHKPNSSYLLPCST